MPDAFADEISLVGPIERIRDRLQAWKESRRVAPDPRVEPEALKKTAEVVMG